MIIAIICFSVAAIPIVAIVQDYLLKKEKIKADILIKTEEIKAKNQFEIEKLLMTNDPKSVQAVNTDTEAEKRSHLKEML
jgi:hypothetical protein